MALSVFGVDYAWGRPSPRVLKAKGLRFAMRYLSFDAGKNLTANEKSRLHAEGIGVGVVWETTANRALKGFGAGAADAQAARNQARAAGLLGAPIYFAVDFDATDRQKPEVATYLRGAVSVLGHDRVGVYGSYYVVKYAAEHKVCKWFWQTYAWSGGLVHPQAHILQYRNGVTIDGVSCDLNKAQVDAGIVYPGAKPTKPKPAPKPDPKARKRKTWREHRKVWRKRLADAAAKVKKLNDLLR